MEPKPLSRALALRIVAAITSTLGIVTLTKTGAPWSALGLLFDGLKLVGLNVPGGAQIVGEYAQTLPLIPGVKTPLSALVLLPDRELSPDGLVELFVHDGTHAAQSRDDAAWAGKYLAHREYRAGTAEAPAFAAALAYRWARTGQLPGSLDDFEHVLRDGYDAQDHAVVGHDVIEIYATEVGYGVIRSPLARLAIALTYRDEPDAIHPESLRLMQANCPSALVVPA